MQRVYSLFRSVSAVSLLALVLAACPGNGAGPVLLTPEQVGGTYEICSLVFTPENPAFREVDIRERAIDMTPNARLRAALRVRNPQTTFALEYTTLEDDIAQLSGSYQLGANTVSLGFGVGAARAALLLPSRLDLEFEETPRKQLTTTQTSTYAVLRADYARLAQMSESGLAPEIPGTLSARFAVGSCE